MYMSPEMMNYFYQLTTYLNSQQKKIEEMNTIIHQLQQDVNGLRNRPNAVKNEYKFDLLKIERLEGTLNIGLNPNGQESAIEDFAVDQIMNVPPILKQDPQLLERIRHQINHYMNHDAYEVLKSIENRLGYPLDDPYRKFIIDDVNKQIPQRIQYYLNQLQAANYPPEELVQAENMTVQKVKHDIEKTFETFINNLPRNKDGS